MFRLKTHCSGKHRAWAAYGFLLSPRGASLGKVLETQHLKHILYRHLATLYSYKKGPCKYKIPTQKINIVNLPICAHPYTRLIQQATSESWDHCVCSFGFMLNIARHCAGCLMAMVSWTISTHHEGHHTHCASFLPLWTKWMSTWIRRRILARVFLTAWILIRKDFRRPSRGLFFSQAKAICSSWDKSVCVLMYRIRDAQRGGKWGTNQVITSNCCFLFYKKHSQVFLLGTHCHRTKGFSL